MSKPFQIQLTVDFPAGVNAPNATFAVPAGKRLVIEYVSALAVLATGQRMMFAQVNTVVAGTLVFHFLKSESIGTATSTAGEGFLSSQMVKLYADPSTEVLVSAIRSDATTAGTVTFAVSGYLVAP